MKWFYLVMSYMVKRFAGAKNEPSPIEELKELIKENAVKILLVFTSAVAIGSFFVAGVTIVLINLTSQYDQGEQLRLSAVATGGLVLIAISAIAFTTGIVFATRHDREKKKMAQKRAMEPEIHSIREAVMLLINDYVAEREFTRSQRRNEAMMMNERRAQSEFMNSPRSSDEFERH